jgi:hypothetical protein
MERYVASISANWEDFTSRHKEVREEVENKVKEFLEGGRPNPLAIRGPIGQGKTQLLYHVFSFVWENGGIAFYTTLDRLLPHVETTASGFAEQIDVVINQCLEKLNSRAIDEIPLLTEEMRGFVKRLGESASRHTSVVLLIDEMERHYEKLLGKVGREPFGYWLEHTACFPVAAFAPLSYYEALYGDAERRRWDSITLPPITALSLRQKTGDMGNFVWWVSRGRSGISYKAMDSSRRKGFVDYKDFKDLSDELGPIAEVPAIDLDALARLSEAYDFVVKLFPQKPASVPYTVEGDIVDKAEFIGLLKDCLRAEGWEDKSLQFFTYYFNMIAEAVSKDSNFLVPLEKYEELQALFNLAVDLAVEHETLENEDVKKIVDRFRELEGKFASFFYTKMFTRVQRLSSSKGSILSYKQLAVLFPPPITSPIFGRIDSLHEAKEIISAKSVYRYVAEDSIETNKGIITFRYFSNETRLKDWLDSSEITGFLPPNKALVCILLSGDPKQTRPTGVAEWLRSVNRLQIETPSKTLCDFVAYFTAWAFKNGVAEGYIDNLRDTLQEQSVVLWPNDKESSRKVSHHLRMLEIFLNSFRDSVSLGRERYSAKACQDSVRSYGSRYARFADVVGLAFTGSRADRDLVYRFRKFLLDSNELKGLRSGIAGLLEDASVTRKGLSKALDDIRMEFEGELSSLLALAHLKEIEEERFLELSERSEGKTVLKGIYRFARGDVSPSQFEEVKRETKGISKEIEKLKEERRKIIGSLGISIRESASEKNQSQFKELEQILSDAESASRYIRWLLVECSRAILKDFKDQYLHPDQTNLTRWQIRSRTALDFSNKKKDIEKLGKEVFDWIDKSKDEVLEELASEHSEALKKLIGYEQQVDWDSVDRLEWSAYEDMMDEVDGRISNLVGLNSKLSTVLQLADEINTELERLRGT